MNKQFAILCGPDRRVTIAADYGNTIWDSPVLSLFAYRKTYALAQSYARAMREAIAGGMTDNDLYDTYAE